MPQPEDPLYFQPEWSRVTLASIGDAVITTDINGGVTFLNPVAESLTGWTRQEAVGQPLDSVFRIINQQSRRTVENPAARALRDGVIAGLANHTLLIAKDGTERPIEDSAAPIQREGGGTIGAVLVFRDVSERRQAEEALRESEARKSAVVNSALDAIVTMDHEGKIVDFNPAAEITFGYKRDEAVGKPMDRLIIPPSYRERHRRGLAQYLATGEGPVLGKRLELPAHRADGSEFPAELTITRMPSVGPPMFTGFIRDITQRKQAEEAVRAGEERYRVLYAALPVAAFVCDRNAVIQNYNPRAVELWGREPKIGVEQHCGSMKLLLPDGTLLPHAQSPMMDVLRTGVPARNVEVFIERPDGSRVAVIVNFVALKDEQGEILGVITSFDDISDCKRAEDALRESKERLANIVESITDAFVTVDSEWRFTFLNQRAKEILFPLKANFLGKNLWQEFPDIIGTPVEENYRRSMAEQVTVGFELWYPPLNGWFEVRTYPSKDGLSIYFQDITERKQTEEYLRQSEERLRVSEEQFRAMADNIPQLAWIARANASKLTWSHTE